jgi:hypothetical protein
MNRFSEKAIAAVAFATALGGSLIAFPLILDNPAFALDANAGEAGAQGHHFPMPGEMVEARLAFAKTAFKITDAQTAAWNAVADVIRRQAKARDAKFAAMRAEHDANPGKPHEFDPIARMEQRQKMMTEQAQELGELLTAAKPLYASLSDDQKQVADHLLMHGMGGERPGQRMGWGGHGPGGHGPGPDAPPPR